MLADCVKLAKLPFLNLHTTWCGHPPADLYFISTLATVRLLKLRYTFGVNISQQHRCQRSGHTGVEMYCQGAFLRSIDARGSPLVRVILRDPRPMQGKVEFTPTMLPARFSLCCTRQAMWVITFIITLGIEPCFRFARNV